MGLVQAFQLLTGDVLQEMLADPDNRIGRLLAAGKSDREIVEELYLAALSRRPTSGRAGEADGVRRQGEGPPGGG